MWVITSVIGGIRIKISENLCKLQPECVGNITVNNIDHTTTRNCRKIRS
jgi:hypothetical protein